MNYQDIFSNGDADIDRATNVKHYINLTDDTSFKQQNRRIPIAMNDEVREHLQQLEACDDISQSLFKVPQNVSILQFC